MRPLTAALVLEKQGFRTQILKALEGIPVRIVLDQGGFGAWQLVREKLQRLLPDMVLVDLGPQSEERFRYIQLVRTLTRPPAVVVIHDADDAQTILSAMRAGAAEFLTVPLEAGALATALDRISTMLPGRPAQAEKGGSVLAFLAPKGGAGATTLACSAAAMLGKSSGREVLLADLDLETGNVAFAMKASSAYSILDACRSISRLDASYWRGLVSNGLPSLHILTAPVENLGLDSPQPVEVRQVLNFARTLYDYTVVDLASSLNPLTLAVLEDADRTFLITTTDLPSLHRAKRALHTLAHVGIAPERVELVVNRCSRRDEVSIDDIERNLGKPVFWRFPHDEDGVLEFYTRGAGIPPKSDLSRSIRQFLEKLTGATPGKKKATMLGL